MTRNRHARIALFAAASLVLVAPRDAQPQENWTAEQREHATAWGAHHLCAGLWIVGRDYPRDPETVVAQDIARFPAFRWEKSFEYHVDPESRTVTVKAPGAPARSAAYYGDQGCVIHERGSREIHFRPVVVPSSLPDPATQPWPTGELNARAPLPADADAEALEAVLDWAMDDAGQNTRALVVVYRGKIIAERYAPGFSGRTPQISWSQGKSITAALVGVLVQQGELELDQPAPVPEWHEDPIDPRRAIKIRDLLHMSSGLDFKNYGVGDSISYTSANEHFMIYFDAVNVFEHAINQPLDIPPNTQFRYRNSDPLTLGRIIRQTVEARGEDYLSFPQRALFDRIGMRNVVLETDTYGNFIMTGYDFVSAYDWARFGLLHLRDGEWQGERILPEGWVEFVSTPTPTDPGRDYGGLFWVNAGGALPDVPPDAFWPAGWMGQNTVIIPSLDMVVVRLGPSPGGSNRYLNRVIAGIIEALRLTR
ncbi:MAG: serine hydrolase [Gemmatimonadales bacterium]|jgi:CubicO group peptidase (beta-lactamase class C family)